jgi:hypothetical protein
METPNPNMDKPSGHQKMVVLAVGAIMIFFFFKVVFF